MAGVCALTKSLTSQHKPPIPCVPACVPVRCVPAENPDFRGNPAGNLRLETPAPEVEFRCYSHCYARSSEVRFRRQPACQPGSSTSPEKYAFAVNRLVNHALLTSRQLPVFVDAGMDTSNSNTRFRGDLMPQFWGMNLALTSPSARSADNLTQTSPHGPKQKPGSMAGLVG